MYGHLSGFAVEVGDQVFAGDIIGYVGQSGTTTGQTSTLSPEGRRPRQSEGLLP